MTPAKKKALMKRITSIPFWVGILGAIKLVTDAFGWFTLDDVKINSAANGMAMLCSLVGIFWGYDDITVEQ
jgi:uncharacterized membrane protein